MTNRALFLDRDGVVNAEVGYLHRPEDVRFLDGIFSLCRTAAALQYRIVIVTNQAGIARGFYTEADFHTLMDFMRAKLRAEGVELDAVYFCPFHPEHGVGAYKQEHEDRKPSTGMLRRAVRELGTDLSQSILIGDRCTDIAAANSAGLRQAFLLTGTESIPCPGRYHPIHSLAEAERWLTSHG